MQRTVSVWLNDEILDWSKLKTFADNEIKVANVMIFVFDRIENIVGKGENAGYQHFLLFPQSFQRTLLKSEYEFFYMHDNCEKRENAGYYHFVLFQQFFH